MRRSLGHTLQSRYHMDDATRNTLLRTMFDLRSAVFSRCFAQPSLCSRPAIRAHSVQNSDVLDLLAVDGHVIAPEVRLDANKGPSISLASIGRNRASTFAGLCAEHDHALFAPIDGGIIDPANSEHAFLLAYRAVLYEVHATAASAWQVQTGYMKRVELGLDSKDQISEAAILATHRIIVAFETFQYKVRFDAAHLTRDFGILSHDLLRIPVSRPSIAASALFSLDHVERDGEVVHVCLTVLPTSHNETVALFSYMNADADLARAELGHVLGASGPEQAYELSRRLLNNCQNFVLSPSYVASWTPHKRKAITDYFIRTLVHDDLAFHEPDLLLFATAA